MVANINPAKSFIKFLLEDNKIIVSLLLGFNTML